MVEFDKSMPSQAEKDQIGIKVSDDKLSLNSSLGRIGLNSKGKFIVRSHVEGKVILGVSVDGVFSIKQEYDMAALEEAVINFSIIEPKKVSIVITDADGERFSLSEV